MANVPKGWWHYIVTLVDNTHILAIFDAPTPEVILGSDILKFTPAHVIAQTYCVDENLWKQATAPVKPTTFIGPPSSCQQQIRSFWNNYSYTPSYLSPSYWR